MSSGRSSQVWACFSVDRTKYLMVSKWMPDRSAPQVGIGCRSNSLSALSRRSSIHCGSLFLSEMSRTTSSSTPRRADAPAFAVRPAERVSTEGVDRGCLIDQRLAELGGCGRCQHGGSCGGEVGAGGAGVILGCRHVNEGPSSDSWS